MQCIYLIRAGVASFTKGEACNIGQAYEIEKDVLSKYCKTENFRNCPRFIAHIQEIQACHHYLKEKEITLVKYAE